MFLKVVRVIVFGVSNLLIYSVNATILHYNNTINLSNGSELILRKSNFENMWGRASSNIPQNQDITICLHIHHVGTKNTYVLTFPFLGEIKSYHIESNDLKDEVMVTKDKRNGCKMRVTPPAIWGNQARQGVNIIITVTGTAGSHPNSYNNLVKMKRNFTTFEQHKKKK